MANKELPHMNVVFIGHVDHGKSTTVGRLLFDGGAVDEQTMRKLKEEAAANGKAGFEFAYTMDNLAEDELEYNVIPDYEIISINSKLTKTFYHHSYSYTNFLFFLMKIQFS